MEANDLATEKREHFEGCEACQKIHRSKVVPSKLACPVWWKMTFQWDSLFLAEHPDQFKKELSYGLHYRWD